MLERNGLRIAAVSYDSRKLFRLSRRSAASDSRCFPIADSAVIRSFGIFNTNIAPGLRAHGVPHPVEYLVAPDGIVIRKYFVPNYQHRVTASAVVLREFGAVSEERRRSITLRGGALSIDWTF